MDLPLIDPRLAAQQALEESPAQRKLQIDALRERLSGGDEAAERKLKEACQGFESIFLQRIWEQMRKNVGKEGFLHSRDEESYQAMFDQELAKKMAEAGGIGLADMLEQQLNVKLGKATIATSPGMLQARQQILPLENIGLPLENKLNFALEPEVAEDENLYSELADQEQDAPAETPEQLALAGDLLEDSLGTHPDAVVPPPAPSQMQQAALSNVDAPVEELARQPGFGLQNQFMLGGGLAAQLAGRNMATAPTTPDAQTQPLDGVSNLSLNQDQTMPPLPVLDSYPADSITAASLLAGQGETPPLTAPVETARAEQAVRPEQGSRFRQSEVKKDTNPTLAEGRPVQGNSALSRFGAARPEVGRAQLEGQSILRPPMALTQTRPPTNESEVSDNSAGLLQGSGIRQISQAEFEEALRRMN